MADEAIEITIAKSPVFTLVPPLTKASDQFPFRFPTVPLVIPYPLGTLLFPGTTAPVKSFDVPAALPKSYI